MPEPSQPSNTPSDSSSNDGMWCSIRKIAIHCIDKGYVFPLGFFSVILFLIWKLENKDTKDVILQIIDRFDNYALMGWVLWVLTCGAWVQFYRWTSDFHQKELDRITDERNIVQAQRLPDNSMKSSTPVKKGKR